MIGTMADILLKKPVYKEQMEKFLVEIVFREFQAPQGHLRLDKLIDQWNDS